MCFFVPWKLHANQEIVGSLRDHSHSVHTKTMADNQGDAGAAVDELKLKRGEKSFHPFSLLSHKLQAEEWLQLTMEWLIDEANNSFQRCVNKDGKALTCQCFSIFNNDPVATKGVAEYLQYFGSCKPLERDRIVMDMVRYQDNVEPPAHLEMESHRYYRLPHIILSSDKESIQTRLRLAEEYFVCISAIQHLIGYGRIRLKRIWKDLGAGYILPRQVKVGLPSNRRLALEKDGVMDDLRNYFEGLCELEEPRATRIVRETAGISLREAGDSVDLPSYMTKRGLYKQFCWYRGIKVSTTARGATIYDKRDDEEWVNRNEEPLTICSWSTFIRFWKEEYGHLTIQRPIKDICNECYRYAMASKRLCASQTSKKKKQAADCDVFGSLDDSSDEEDSVDEILHTSLRSDQIQYDDDKDDGEDDNDEEKNDGENNNNQTDVNIEMSEMEAALMEVSTHIEDALAQRKLAARLREKALLDTKNNVPFQERTLLFYFDFAQTVQCPFFGFEQPGETYYFSPLSINVFGITDSCNEEETMHAYCYHEGEGRKGGNNVASMLDWYLRKKLKMPVFVDMNMEETWGGHLQLVADNCGGQNKNRMVLRYCCYLVETKKFKSVRLMFLIAGHTKNPCDRLFNLLKKDYRQKNIFCVEDLITVLNANSFTTAESGVIFRDWDTYLDKYYKPSDSIQKWHIFEINSTTPSTVHFRRSDAVREPEYIQDLLIPGVKDRKLQLRQAWDFPVRLTPPGIRVIKRNELAEKFLKFVPQQYHHLDIYQKPTKEELAPMKEKQSVTRKKYYDRKKEEKEKNAQGRPKGAAEESKLASKPKAGKEASKKRASGKESQKKPPPKAQKTSS